MIKEIGRSVLAAIIVAIIVVLMGSLVWVSLGKPHKQQLSLPQAVGQALDSAIAEKNGKAASVLCALMGALIEGSEAELAEFTGEFVDRQIEREEKRNSLPQPPDQKVKNEDAAIQSIMGAILLKGNNDEVNKTDR